MKTFKMVRNFDESGVSGTGEVLQGCIFSNGSTVVYWTASEFNSFGIYKNFYEFYAIHIKSHPTNDTELIFDEETPSVQRGRRKQCRHCKYPYEDHPKDRQSADTGLRRSCSGNVVELIDEIS